MGIFDHVRHISAWLPHWLILAGLGLEGLESPLNLGLVPAGQSLGQEGIESFNNLRPESWDLILNSTPLVAFQVSSWRCSCFLSLHVLCATYLILTSTNAKVIAPPPGIPVQAQSLASRTPAPYT